MKLLKTFLFLSILFFFKSSDPFYGGEFYFSSLPSSSKDSYVEKVWIPTNRFDSVLRDDDERVSNIFQIPNYFYSSTHFWFLIYTQFDSNTIVIHDKNNLSLIYIIFDFSPLIKKGAAKSTVYHFQNKTVNNKIRELKKDLLDLSVSPFSKSHNSNFILSVLRRANVVVPKDPSKRKDFFIKLSLNLRSQTGQKNFIQDGIQRSLPYEKFLISYFTKRNLPKELLAIPFLESSFNPKAQSKVNALGIWQFMPLISSYYVPRRSRNIDYRFNVGVASIAAAFLMSENYQITKSWDLAVTAYNSGTKHLLKTKRRLGIKKVSLESIIENSDSRHFGFASKNFYSEFLALVHALAYKEKFFKKVAENDRSDHKEDLRFFLTKCNVNLDFDLNSVQLDDVIFHNHHTNNKRLPKGFILTAKSHLPQNKFYEISKNELIRNKPKKWHRLLNKKRCGA